MLSPARLLAGDLRLRARPIETDLSVFDTRDFGLGITRLPHGPHKIHWWAGRVAHGQWFAHRWSRTLQFEYADDLLLMWLHNTVL